MKSNKELCAKRMTGDKALEAGLKDTGYSMNELQGDLYDAVKNVASLQTVTTGPNGEQIIPAIPFVCDLVAPGHEDGETWTAIVMAGDGKLYALSFTLAGDNVQVVGEPRAIEATQDWEYVNEENEAKAAQMRSNALKAGSFRGGGSSHRQAKADAEEFSNAARMASREAHRASKDALDADGHRTAAALHDSALAMQQRAGVKRSAMDDDDAAEEHMSTAEAHRALSAEHKTKMEACMKAAEVEAKAKLTAGAPMGNQNASGPHKDSAKVSEHLDERTKFNHKYNDSDLRKGDSQEYQDSVASSRDAHQSSAQAFHTGEKSDHRQASEAHRSAEVSHIRAAQSAKTEKEKAFHYESALAHANFKRAHEEHSGGAATEAKSAINCAGTGDFRSAVVKLDDVLMFMPAGVHSITPSQNGKAVTVTVEVNAQSAETLEKQRRKLEAAGKKPFFSVQHDTEIAAFWPSRFFWDKRIDATGSFVEGVWAEGEWTKSGREAVEGKDFRTFSPTFFVDAIRTSENNPSKVICESDARANMGALENDPAFQRISPLWCKNANNLPPGGGGTAGASGKTTNGQNMKEETIAELQARNTNLEAKLAELTAKDDAVSKAELRAIRSELAEIQARIEVAEAKDKIVALEANETKRKESEAETAVAQMVNSGALAPRDTELQATYKAKFIADPSLIPLMAGRGMLTPQGGGRVAKGGTEGEIRSSFGYGGVKEGSINVLKAFVALLAKQNPIKGMSPFECQQRSDLALQASMIYQNEIRGPLNSEGMPTMKLDFINAPLQAAADSDVLGTLVGTLVTQRMLDLFRYQFPLLSRILTDFSDEPSDLNQVVTTRKVLIPSVQTYNNTLDTDNRPIGWGTASNGQTTDISITLDELVGVPIPFSLATLSATQRKLFQEQAPAGVYALVKYYMAKIYAVATQANFNAYAAVTVADAQGVIKVPIAYPTFAVAEIDFGRNAVTKMGAAFDANEVPEEMRTVLVNPAHYAAGTRDPSLVTFFAGQNNPEMITEGVIPKLNNFGLVKAQNFPATNNRVGLVLQKNGLLAKSRLPVNYMELLPGAGNGSITQITDAQTGFSMMLIQYVNNTRGFAEWLPCAIIGAAKGDTRGGIVLTSS